MVDQENYTRVTRFAAKKRAAEGAIQQMNIKKKRVVLGEIQNVLSSKNLGLDKNQKLGIENEKKKNKPKKNWNKGKSSVEEEKASGINLDVKKCNDPQMCEAYVSDIYEYLHNMEMEAKRRPLPNYLEKIQKDVTANMRGILIDWLVEVAEEYNLLSDTLYLTVSYVDRFLSTNAVNRQRLQLLGVSSMLIASKYEEISPPHVEDFCYITDNTYTKEDVVKMEADVLKSLKFEMGNPTVKTFLRDPKECVGILHDLQMSRRGSALVAVREKYKQHKSIRSLAMVEGTRLKDLQETQKRIDQILQTEAMKREAAELKLQEQLTGVTSEVQEQISGLNGRYDHLTNTLAAIQLQLLNSNKGKTQSEDESILGGAAPWVFC
ncbi:hypothetical protein DH2020_027250 [Rehmannia glutinosa]|uniref:Cyclin-like domain-containing protein n=1 Tax=Rehmannia glutinosa TaxID=99300 RepID=A0ABR0VY70_REHGL